MNLHLSLRLYFTRGNRGNENENATQVCRPLSWKILRLRMRILPSSRLRSACERSLELHLHWQFCSRRTCEQLTLSCQEENNQKNHGDGVRSSSEIIPIQCR